MTVNRNIHRIILALTFRGGVLVSFLVLSVLLFVFVKVASEVGEGDTMAFDQLVMACLRNPANLSIPIGPPWLQSAMLDITTIGGVAVLTLLTVIVAAFLAVIGKTKLAIFVVVAVSTGAAASTFLKSIFIRPRPDLVAHLVDVNTTSFPSGHAMNSAIVYLTLGALLAETHLEPKAKGFIMVVSVALTLMVGFSRVYLGVHWPSDVIAGWAIGASWAILCSLTLQLVQGKTTLGSPTANLD